MVLARRGRIRTLWDEFQRDFSDFAGFSVQVFEPEGAAASPAPPLPTLCTFLERYPEVRGACLRDCYRKAAAIRSTRHSLAARCHAGLSYRVAPIRRRGEVRATILVGRVLTEVSGGEQHRDFIERHRLDGRSFLEALRSVPTRSGEELERAAAFVRRMALAFAAADSRFEAQRRLRDSRQRLLEFGREAAAFRGPEPAGLQRLLEYLARAVEVPGAALLADRPAGGSEVLASVGLGEEALHGLASADWEAAFRVRPAAERLALADRQAQLARGLDLPSAPVTVQRLGAGSGSPGHLVLTGAVPAGDRAELLDFAADALASRVVHARCREAVDQRARESRLLAQLAERCLTARSVEEILPLALEAAMQGVGAGRGSILLAEQEGRILAQALRGDHAPLAGTIESLQPETVSHRVFYEQRPLLVRDTGQEPGLERERQYPYASRSFVSVPLRNNGQALGVLHLTERRGAEAFTTGDLELLERLGLQAAVAIRSARLQEEVQVLQVHSTTDHLTGIPNRRYLDARLPVEIQRAGRFGQTLAVVMLDLDGFKSLNDRCGHACGDRVLRETAEAIRRPLRSIDLVARYGGDEFVVLLPGADERAARGIVDKICASVATVRIEDPDAPGGPALSASAGLAVYPETEPGELLHRADEELLAGKRARSRA